MCKLFESKFYCVQKPFSAGSKSCKKLRPVAMCHEGLFFGCIWTLLETILGCLWPSPWWNRPEKSDLFGHRKCIRARVCFSRVSRWHFGSQLEAFQRVSKNMFLIFWLFFEFVSFSGHTSLRTYVRHAYLSCVSNMRIR